MKIKLIAFSLLFLFSCVSTKAVRLGNAPIRSQVSWQQVAVYRTADQVPGKYEEIAMMVSTGEHGWTTEQGMWTSMKKKAGAMGANAIILDGISEPSAGAKVASAIFGVGGAERKGKAIAIYIFPAEE